MGGWLFKLTRLKFAQADFFKLRGVGPLIRHQNLCPSILPRPRLSYPFSSLVKSIHQFVSHEMEWQ